LTVTPKPADAVTTQTITKSLSLGMVLIIQLNRILQNGCTADQVLNLTVTQNQPAVTTNNLFWGNFLLEWYWLYLLKLVQESLQRRMYCRSSIELDCNLNQRMPLLHKPICSGESFSWNGTDYTSTQAGTRIAKTVYCRPSTELDCYPKPADAVYYTNNLFWRSFSWNGTDYTTTRWYKSLKRMYCWSSIELDCWPNQLKVSTQLQSVLVKLILGILMKLLIL
jgi:hypothetical protein